METVNDPTRTAPRADAPASPPLPEVPGYEVLALVGRGGMGKVYRARHTALGRVVALKVIAREADDRLLARFAEEARAVAKLQHPNIAQLFESGLADGRPFYTQEYLDGGSLAQVFDGRPQNPTAAARTVETLARAIQHSHDHGILHRDLKPANVLLAADGTPKVTDFGLAKTLGPADGDGETAPAGLTRTGEIVGTPAYMPPEQASGIVSGLGPGCDVYGLGAILYEALTGRPPFQAPDPFQTVLMVLSMDPVSPRALQPDVPRDLETVCLKCLEKSPRKRYRSAGELADDLRRFLNREPILARPVGFFERAAKWSRRKPWQAAAVGLLVVMVAGLAGGLAWAVGKNREVRDANTALGQTVADLERANRDATAQKSRAEAKEAEAVRTLAITLYTLETYFFTFSDRLRDVPRGEHLRREVLDNARATLDRLHDFDKGNVAIQERRMTGYDRLGNAEAALGNTAAAEADYRRSREIAVELEGRHPENPNFLRGRVLAVAKLAELLGRRDPKAGDALLDTVLPDLAKIAARLPDDVGVLELRAVVALQLSLREMRAMRWDAAEERMREICALSRRLARQDRDNPARVPALIDADTRLALFLIDAGKLDEAGTLLESVRGVLPALPDPDTPAARRLKAFVHRTSGSYHDRRDEHARAAESFAAAVAEHDALAADFPNTPAYRLQLGDALRYLASSTVLAGGVAEGVKHLRRCEEVFAKLVKDFPEDELYRTRHADVSALLKKVAPSPKPPEDKP